MILGLSCESRTSELAASSFATMCASEETPRRCLLYRIAREMLSSLRRHSSPSTRRPCARTFRAIAAETSLPLRCRIARRWSSLHTPSFESASRHEMRTTSCSRTTDSAHVFGGSVKSLTVAVRVPPRRLYHIPTAAIPADAAAISIARGRRRSRGGANADLTRRC
eukprot:29427-Pelagococcus_subviridis.AAC.10